MPRRNRNRRKKERKKERKEEFEKKEKDLKEKEEKLIQKAKEIRNATIEARRVAAQLQLMAGQLGCLANHILAETKKYKNIKRNSNNSMTFVKIYCTNRVFQYKSFLLVKKIVYEVLNSYFGGARSKGFATLRNVSKLQFFDKIGQAQSVGFRLYSAV